MTTPTPTDRRHFLDGGPFAVCACGFKEHVSHIGGPCLRCGQRFDGPFVDCPHCDGTGVVDSGGVSPWGEWLNDVCTACNGTGRIQTQETQP